MINGKILRDAIISGANNIANHRHQVDALNVFPVPDGDTGTNMGMTISAAKRELERLRDDATVAQVSKVAASALLRGARGNSGVILSLLFRGFSKGLAGKQVAGAREISDALALGVESAYKAVMKPTEGTMLTVARIASARASAYDGDPEDVAAIWKVILEGARESLAQTPDLLPVLKKAGVVDAGGQGLVCIFEGMDAVFSGGAMVPPQEEEGKKEESIYPDRNAAGEYEGEITYGYCTEFIVLKKDKGEDGLSLRAYLESIGDCVVVVDDEEIIKCHVHTDNPGNALQSALALGQLTKIKIENMREQHAAQQQEAAAPKEEGDPFPYAPVDEDTPYGFVAVAAGEGVKQLFLDLGVNQVVSGGQTMNPSTDEILRAIQATPAKTVIVLPNNKNIIMAAEQTISLADRKVKVLPTRTVPQGLSAMLAFDPEKATEENLIAMGKAADKVGTGSVTFAARDSDYDGHHIKEGELLALENGRVAFTDKDLVHAAVKLTRSLMKKDTSFITIIYGEDVSPEQAAQVEEAVRDRVPDSVELVAIPGGQPVYYLLISVE